MRTVALVVMVAACGEPQKPILANAPHPDNAAVAGGAAAAAAAITIADPNAATRGKPEKPKEEEKQPVEVKEHVPKDVFDRLDKPKSNPAAKPTTATPAPKKGPLPKLPSPKEAAEHEEGK
jgi:hypothetical protein